VPSVLRHSQCFSTDRNHGALVTWFALRMIESEGMA